MPQVFRALLLNALFLHLLHTTAILPYVMNTDPSEKVSIITVENSPKKLLIKTLFSQDSLNSEALSQKAFSILYLQRDRRTVSPIRIPTAGTDTPQANADS